MVFLSFGKFTAAVVLAVETVFFREFDGTEIPAAFFEVGGEVADLMFRFQPLPDLVQTRGVFVRADREGGGEKVKPVFLCGFGGRGKTQVVALRATRTAFGFVLKPRCEQGEFFGVVRAGEDGHGMRKFHLGDQAFQFIKTGLIFAFGLDIGVVKKECDRKMARQILQHVTCAGRTARVQEKGGDGISVFFDDRIGHKLIIFFHHTIMVHAQTKFVNLVRICIGWRGRKRLNSSKGDL